LNPNQNLDSTQLEQFYVILQVTQGSIFCLNPKFTGLLVLPSHLAYLPRRTLSKSNNWIF